MQQDIDKNKWSDERLFWEAWSGDEQAFEVLVERLKYIARFLSALCRKEGIPKGIATTLTWQTIRAAVAESKGKAIPPQQDRWDWLQRLAKKEFDLWYAANKQILRPRQAPQTTRAQISDQTQADRDRLTNCVGKYLAWLERDQRDIIELVMLQGMTVEEAGKTIGWDAKKSREEYKDSHRNIANFIDVHGCE